MIHLPQQVHTVLQRLDRAGYEAYIVGGCVRDHLRGTVPSDYDITTSALPEQMLTVFSDLRVIETGLKHGTVTVLLDGMSLEITTYRLESAYTDHRHPDSVRFTRCLREDLARRDLTVNAMAYHPDQGLVDYFGGQEDLERGIIRCVGDPMQRFEEDALRIMRALRFASVLDFTIEPQTRQAIFALQDTLDYVSRERIAVELVKLLCGTRAGDILLEYTSVLGVCIPELLPLQGFQQHNPYHIYDVLEHTARVVDHSPATKVARLAALLHDIAKPPCFTLDSRGIGHFRGHPAIGADMADGILRRLKFDNTTRKQVVELIRWHDAPLSASERTLRRVLRKISPELFFPLLDLKKADNLAQNPAMVDPGQVDQMRRKAEDILSQQQCFDLKNLAVNGADLLALGMHPGKDMGKALNWLLDEVISERVPNERQALLSHWTAAHPTSDREAQP